MNYKDYFKKSLMEDLGTPELMASIERKYERTGKDPSDVLDRIARSPYLYVPHPDNPEKAMRIPDAKLHPKLSFALSNAVEFGDALSTEDKKIIKDFIRQHGHFVGAANDPDLAYPDKFQTNRPEVQKVLKNKRKKK